MFGLFKALEAQRAMLRDKPRQKLVDILFNKYLIDLSTARTKKKRGEAGDNLMKLLDDDNKAWDILFSYYK